MKTEEVKLGEFVRVEFTGKLVGYDASFKWAQVETADGALRNVGLSDCTLLDESETQVLHA